MSGVRTLRIRRGTRNVGLLFAMDDGRTYFRFDDDYALDPARPILSYAFTAQAEAATQALLINPHADGMQGPGNGTLPTFFSNLLPEGILRRHLVEKYKLAAQDEFALLAACGKDLPGDVWAVAEELPAAALGRLVTQGRESYEQSSFQIPSPDAISLSGVQPKVALMSEPGGRYVMRSKLGRGRHFIGKLPASDNAGMPEVEFTSLRMAAAAGVACCNAQLLPLTAIADRLPFSLRDDARNFLLVERFDRDVDSPTGRCHMEDLAQALEMPPGQKYAGDYASIGLVLQSACAEPESDILELVRRLKVNEMLGNYDAHLKNFSILHQDTGSARLSPAYDIVAHSAYLAGSGHALKFYSAQPERTNLSPLVVRWLANIWKVAEKKLTDTLVETVDRAMTTWPQIIAESPMSEQQKKMVTNHLEQNPSARAWTGRTAAHKRIKL